MRQLQFFTSSEMARMRDRTAARNYSPERDEFRRVHKGHRDWGLVRRYAAKQERLRAEAGTQPPAAVSARSTSPRVEPGPVAREPVLSPAGARQPTDSVDRPRGGRSLASSSPREARDHAEAADRQQPEAGAHADPSDRVSWSVAQGLADSGPAASKPAARLAISKDTAERAECEAQLGGGTGIKSPDPQPSRAGVAVPDLEPGTGEASGAASSALRLRVGTWQAGMDSASRPGAGTAMGSVRGPGAGTSLSAKGSADGPGAGASSSARASSAGVAAVVGGVAQAGNVAEWASVGWSDRACRNGLGFRGRRVEATDSQGFARSTDFSECVNRDWRSDLTGCGRPSMDECGRFAGAFRMAAPGMYIFGCFCVRASNWRWRFPLRQIVTRHPRSIKGEAVSVNLFQRKLGVYGDRGPSSCCRDGEDRTALPRSGGAALRRRVRRGGEGCVCASCLWGGASEPVEAHDGGRGRGGRARCDYSAGAEAEAGGVGRR